MRLIKLTLLVAVLIVSSSFSPQGFSFQAIITDSSNMPVTNQTIGVQISILEGSSTGTAVYVETQSTSTNDVGLISLNIGSGSVVTGTFTSIDWGAADYWIKTEYDISGGTSYTLSSAQQLLSVPYAMYAKRTEQNKYYIGQIYTFSDNTSGIIFHLDFDANGEQHGLVVSADASRKQWSSSNSSVGADSEFDGSANTAKMISSDAKTWVQSSPRNANWYVPSMMELRLLRQNMYVVNKTLESNNSSFFAIPNSDYWSSRERSASLNTADGLDIRTGSLVSSDKTSSLVVRAVRGF